MKKLILVAMIFGGLIVYNHITSTVYPVSAIEDWQYYSLSNEMSRLKSTVSNLELTVSNLELTVSTLESTVSRLKRQVNNMQ